MTNINLRSLCAYNFISTFYTLVLCDNIMLYKYYKILA